MQSVTVTYQVYKFDELTEDIQDKVIEKLYDINVNGEWWDGDYHLELSDDERKSRRIHISDKWWESEKPKDSQGNIIGEYPAHTGLFRYVKIYFSIDQNSYIQFPDLEVTNDDIFRRFLRIPKRLWDDCEYSFYLEGFGSGRNRTTRMNIEPDKYDGNDFTDNQQEIIDRACGIMGDKIDEALIGLQKEYEYQTSREAIVETIKANDYDFTVEGMIA